MSFTFPQGESFAETASRIERGLKQLSKLHPKETICIVTHGDIIKLATQITVGGDLDKFQRLVVDTCSLSIIDWQNNQRTLVSFNQKIIKVRRKQKKRVRSLRNRRVIGGGSGV